MSIALEEPDVLERMSVKPANRPSPGPLFRISVAQYLEMLRANILRDGDRVELLEGVLVAKLGRNPPHLVATKLLFVALVRVLPNGWHVAKEDPLQTRDSLLEPDGAVLRGEIRDYAARIPAAQDFGFVVEVSESILARDRGIKMRAYARAAIPIYWIVNLIDRRVEIYTDPTGPDERPTYRVGWAFGPEDELPVILDGREVGRIAVRDLLP